MTSPELRTITHTGKPERLDKIVAAACADIDGATRSQIAQWIERESVTVNGVVESRPGAKISGGAIVVIAPPAPPPSHLAPYHFPLEIVFEDDHLLVINKPSGLSMHPGAGNKENTLANAVVAHVGSSLYAVGEVDRPGIVHRLDKDTTGLVVVAKSQAALSGLALQFSERSVGREYLALVFTTPRAKRAVQLNDSGEISAAIGRHLTERTKMSVIEGGENPDGPSNSRTARSAVTQWRVVERFVYGTLVANRLKTGRTHQIRVHMEHIGSPVVGDTQYGNFASLPHALKEASDAFGRQALHAATLEFTHPITGERLTFHAEMPGDMKGLVENFRMFQG